MMEAAGTAGSKRRGAAGRPRELGELLDAAGVRVRETSTGTLVRSIEYDSRRVTPGALFVAVRGLTTDGHLYVPRAAEAGAAAALVEEQTGETGLVEVVVPDTRTALGLVAHEFHGRPSELLRTHGITGTNGKTTTSYLLDSVLREAGLRTGVVGTLGYRVGGDRAAGDMTSPESLDLARLLASMVAIGTDAVIMEVSSHALALRRTVGTTFDTATFTNISRDHLDFHGSFDDYAASKRLLFEQLAGEGGKDGATAVINGDDEYGARFIEHVRSLPNVRLVCYGRSGGDVHVLESESTPAGTRALFATPGGSVEAELRLISEFNVMNALAATAIAFSQGVAPDVIGAGLSRVECVEGRLEAVDAGQDFTIVVDYAHTPDALAKALEALRGLTNGRVITVFGCGGDRDRGKRPMMGRVAVEGSDLAVVTSDNPRTEDPDAIIDEIMVGACAASGGSLEKVRERAEAIRLAVRSAARGDIVLIAGKGHEDYQVIGTEKVHFDDREQARAAVAETRSRGTDGEGAAD